MEAQGSGARGAAAEGRERSGAAAGGRLRRGLGRANPGRTLARAGRVPVRGPAPRRAGGCGALALPGPSAAAAPEPSLARKVLEASRRKAARRPGCGPPRARSSEAVCAAPPVPWAGDGGRRFRCQGVCARARQGRVPAAGLRPALAPCAGMGLKGRSGPWSSVTPFNSRPGWPEHFANEACGVDVTGPATERSPRGAPFLTLGGREGRRAATAAGVTGGLGPWGAVRRAEVPRTEAPLLAPGDFK